MIPNYINQWFTIIEQMQNDNTYKLAWGRAIVECITFDKTEVNDKEIKVFLTDIAQNVIKYYWNQLFYFNLKQSPYSNKKVVIYDYVEKLIDRFKLERNSSLPIWFDEALKYIEADSSFYQLYIKTKARIANVFHQNVAHRFLNVSNNKLEVYKYDRSLDYISFKSEDRAYIKEYNIILSKLLNYRWALLLEKYNYCPKILSKVSGASDTVIRRESLSKYKNQLLKEFKDGRILDFYTGKELKEDEISIDHVIPWSFMYSDDIWNLVVTSKSNNSKKSNSIPTSEVIEKLKERNERIKNEIDSSFSLQMLEAINNNYVDKYYFESRL